MDLIEGMELIWRVRGRELAKHCRFLELQKDHTKKAVCSLLPAARSLNEFSENPETPKPRNPEIPEIAREKALLLDGKAEKSVGPVIVVVKLSAVVCC